uniref:RmlD-like substrate binding domain-containing protein n=1 Tax=viral metagenome TaxID=1070528 RepID=A0A6C0KPI8_9ZZZZ
MLLITGISGLLGRTLANVCDKENIPYIGTHVSREHKHSYCINYLNEKELYDFLNVHAITTCVHCIVERQVDVCESDWNKTKTINVDIVDHLARACKKLNIHLIHISTDYVFDGKCAPYYPGTEVNPLQNYGMSKLLSEKRVVSHLSNYTILRVPVLYSDDVENLSESAVTIIGKKVLNQVEATKEDDYSVRRPVFIPDLCAFILSFVHRPQYGVFHFYHPTHKTTKYQMAQQIGTFLNMPTLHIEPVRSYENVAHRPYDTQLLDNQYNIHDFHHTSLEDGIASCFQKWKFPKVTETTDPQRFFILMDLDGTLVDTDPLHHQAYQHALHPAPFTWRDFEQVIHYSNMEQFLKTLPVTYDEIKKKKKQWMLEQTSLRFIEGADVFLQHLLQFDFNVVIVTNTSREIVEHYQKHLPLLQKVKNWITREDYDIPKPHSECYERAVQQYYKGETYKIGFENTLTGYRSIKESVDRVYFITNKDSVAYDTIKKEDIYLLPNYHSL